MMPNKLKKLLNMKMTDSKDCETITFNVKTKIVKKSVYSNEGINRAPYQASMMSNDYNYNNVSSNGRPLDK